MNDQERITDLILSEKKMSANYDTFASECVNVQLRDEYLKLFQQGHQTQTYLYPKNQHCVVLCGACPDPETGGTVYRYMDPLTGEVERMDSQQFAQCYDSMGCQAVALLPDALAQCIRCG